MISITGVPGSGKTYLSSILREKGFHVAEMNLLYLDFLSPGQFSTIRIKAIRDEDWVLVRPSGTEPIIRIFGQSESMERAFELSSAMAILW